MLTGESLPVEKKAGDNVIGGTMNKTGAFKFVATRVGMAIGSGTDIAKETGHVILIKDDLRDVVFAIEVAQATMRKVKQNLFWAFIYNTLGIPIAAGLLYPFFQLVISPELAAALMAVSSLTVTLNTLLLRGFVPSLKRGGGGSRRAEEPSAQRQAPTLTQPLGAGSR